jgi:hypothetical protein
MMRISFTLAIASVVVAGCEGLQPPIGASARRSGELYDGYKLNNPAGDQP